MSMRYERHMKHEFPATGGFVKNDRFSTKSALIKEFLFILKNYITEVKIRGVIFERFDRSKMKGVILWKIKYDK